MLLESRRIETQPRSTTGWPLDEATDPAGNPSSADRKFDWVPTNPRKDFSAKALHDFQEKYFKKYPSAKGDPSLLWRVQKVPRG